MRKLRSVRHPCGHRRRGTTGDSSTPHAAPCHGAPPAGEGRRQTAACACTTTDRQDTRGWVSLTGQAAAGGSSPRSTTPRAAATAAEPPRLGAPASFTIRHGTALSFVCCQTESCLCHLLKPTSQLPLRPSSRRGCFDCSQTCFAPLLPSPHLDRSAPTVPALQRTVVLCKPGPGAS